MRYSIKRHLKPIPKIVDRIDKGSVKQDSFTIAQIHGTILSILIALFSISALYHLNILREKEKVVFNDASRVNQLNFPILFVFPSSEFPFLKDADDSVELAAVILSLADCVSYQGPDKIVTSKDIILRAKSIYSIINVVSHRHPFPEYPVEKSNVFNKIAYKQFDNIEQVRKWNTDLQKVCRALYLPVEMLVNRPQIGDSLLNSDNDISRLKGFKPFFSEFGRFDLHSVERDFKSELKKALDLSNTVEFSLKDYDRFKKALLNRWAIFIFISGLISFCFGVIYPIICQSPKPIIYKWAPICFYFIVIIYLPVKIYGIYPELFSFRVRLPILKTKQASFIRLGDLPGGDFMSTARGISGDGKVVVGSSYSSSGYEAFRWSENTGIVGIGDLPGGLFNSRATAVSADGTVIIGAGTSSLSTPNEEAFLWTEKSGIVPLGDLHGDPFRSEAFSISADGKKIVGRSWITGSDQRAFLWTESQGMVDLGTFPGEDVSEAYGISGEGMTIVGWVSSVGSSLEAFRWTQNTGMVGLGRLNRIADNIVNADSYAYHVSADGSTIVGTAGVCSKAFRWKEETGMIAISECGGRANAASHDGSIVVGQIRSLGEKEAAIWFKTNVPRNLEEILTNEYGVDLMGFELKEACDISDDGSVIVGWGINPQGFEEAWIVKINPNL